jgi:hypothetical protein
MNGQHLIAHLSTRYPSRSALLSTGSQRPTSITMAEAPTPDPTCTDCLPENTSSDNSVQNKTTSAKQDEDIEDPSTFKPLERSIGPAVTIEYCDGVSLPLRPISLVLTILLLIVSLGPASILDRHRTIPDLSLTHNHKHNPHSRHRTSRSIPCMASAAE